MSGILGTALSGLMAFQRALDTTSHNIANVNTEGYSRQQVQLSAASANFTDGQYFGQGVNVASVSRSYDQFISAQLGVSTSAYGESNTLSTMASRIDNITSSDATSLAPALKSFFNSVNGVANDPTSIPAREVMTSEADALAHQFNQLSDKFGELRNQTNSQMQSSVDDINLYAESLASLNSKIALEKSRNSGDQLPNDLLDQRDLLINKIAQKVSVSTLAQDNGTVDVFIGKGQALVLGASTSKLSLIPSSIDQQHLEVALDGKQITKNISGGELSGALKFRDQILDPAQKQLGLVAAGVAVKLNEVHSTGYDLNGDPGTEMFSLGTPSLGIPAIAKPGSVGSVTASYDPSTIGQLTPSDYELSFDGSSFSLKNLSDNTVKTFPGTPPSTISGPGFSISTDASVAANDSFLIRPTYNAAQNITSKITDPAKIAAAGTTGGSGLPNTGDNTVALSLAGLENATVLSGGKSTLSDSYGKLVFQVGAQTHSAQVSSSAQESLLNQATLERESLAGVNLDEEAANLLKYQQSYQAAAQVVTVANTLFDTLIGAIRR